MPGFDRLSGVLARFGLVISVLKRRLFAPRVGQNIVKEILTSVKIDQYFRQIFSRLIITKWISWRRGHHF